MKIEEVEFVSKTTRHFEERHKNLTTLELSFLAQMRKVCEEWESLHRFYLDATLEDRKKVV